MKLTMQPYIQKQPCVPVHQITPPDGYYIHTFYDVTPWSPSGRHLVCLRLPFQHREPEPHEAAEICVIDLHERRIEPVYRTTGWALQMAAHQMWGRTDRYLYFNDKRDGLPVGIRLDLTSGRADVLGGTIYQVAPDESFALSPSLIGTNKTQAGYGVSVAPEYDFEHPPGASSDDGLWHVDLRSGKSRLLLSFAEVHERLPDKDRFVGGTFYGFHVKFNRQQTRIMFVVRVVFPGRRTQAMLITCRTDGSDMHVAVPAERWSKGGHHPDWHPDGERIVINLKDDQDLLRFYEFRYDGSGERVLAPGLLGSGHPSFSLNGRYLITDAYPRESVCREEWVPLRLINVERGEEQVLCWMWTMGGPGGVLRVDPHPVWNRTFDQICFTGAPEEKRQLFVADLSELGLEFRR